MQSHGLDLITIYNELSFDIHLLNSYHYEGLQHDLIIQARILIEKKKPWSSKAAGLLSNRFFCLL